MFGTSYDALTQAEALRGRPRDPAVMVIEGLNLLAKAAGDDGMSPLTQGSYTSPTALYGD